jgi:hypothetical protein
MAAANAKLSSRGIGMSKNLVRTSLLTAYVVALLIRIHTN